MIRQLLMKFRRPVRCLPQVPAGGVRRPLWSPAPARIPLSRLRGAAVRALAAGLLLAAGPALADAELTARLADAVAEKAGGGRMIVELAPPRGKLPDAPGALDAVAYDARTARFTATTPGADGAPVALAGRAFPAVEVPVLARRLDKGEVIASGDIDYTLVRADRLSPQVATDPAGIVGLAARRAVAAGVPLRGVDLEKPRAIEKGELVTLSLSAPGLTLTLRGRALADGAAGDTIRVANLTSNRVVAGVVDGPGLVSVPALP